MKVPKTWTVLVDTREQLPLLFRKSLVLYPETAAGPFGGKPVVCKVQVERVKFNTGDYLLKGYETVTGVERKKGVDELAGNLCSRDRHRFMAALGTFIEAVKHPILFIEEPFPKWWKPKGTEQDPGRVMDRLFNTLGVGGVDILWASTSSSKAAARYLQGEIVLRRMISHVLREKS